MKARDGIVVTLYLAVAVTPVVALQLGVADHETFGALAAPKTPRLTVGSVYTERFQRDATAWFESKLGLKGYSITTDNAILYHAFGETKPGSAVVVGDRGVLFKDEDIAHFNNALVPDPQRVDALAKQIADLQHRLAAQHRAFVPLIIPGKSLLYRDEIPARWSRDVGEPRPCDTIYASLIRALDARGVVYANVHELFATSTYPREQLWGPQGRHWSALGACLAMQQVSKAYAILTGKPPLPYECSARLRWHPLENVDFDLLQLLNTWGLPHRIHTPTVDHSWPDRPDTGPSIMFIGTSFMWTVLDDSRDSHLFVARHMDYYDKTLVESPSRQMSPVVPRSAAWRELFLTRDIYVLDLFEEYLFVPESYVYSFIGELDAEVR